MYTIHDSSTVTKNKKNKVILIKKTGLLIKKNINKLRLI